MIAATMTFAGILAVGVFLPRFIDRRNGMDALGSLFGLLLTGWGPIDLFF